MNLQGEQCKPNILNTGHSAEHAFWLAYLPSPVLTSVMHQRTQKLQPPSCANCKHCRMRALVKVDPKLVERQKQIPGADLRK